MKIKNLKKYIKRVTAAALCAVCLIGVCGQGVSAAAAKIVQLEYLNNRYGMGDKPEDVKYTAGILADNSLEVQMSLGQYSLMQGKDAIVVNRFISAAPEAGRSLPAEPEKNAYTFTVDPTGNGTVFDVGASLAEGVGQVVLQLKGNTAALQPSTGGAFEGTVRESARRMSEFAYIDVDDNRQFLLSDESSFQIVCLAGQEPDRSVPVFGTVTNASGDFAAYNDATVSVTPSLLKPDPDGKDGKKLNYKGREITIRLEKAGQETLIIRLTAPAIYDDIPHYIVNSDATIGEEPVRDPLNRYVNENGDLYDKKEEFLDDDPNKPNSQWRSSVQNNYFRGGVTYTISFSPPASTTVSLSVATPKYVAEQLLVNIRNNRGASKPGAAGVDGRFITWVGQDSPGLIANDTFTLKCLDERYNANFYIYWLWKWDETQNGELKEGDDGWVTPADARQAIKINQEKTSTEIVAQIQRQIEDVHGSLYARIVYFDGSVYHPLLTEQAKDGDGNVTDGSIEENGQVYQLIYPSVVVRGSGIKATTELVSSTTGPVPDENGDFPQNDTPTPNPKEDKTMPTQLKTMDIFRGRVRGYSAAPVGPYQHLLRMNMGAKNAAAMFAVVTVDTPDIVELRTNSEQLYLPRVADELYIEQKNYSEKDFAASQRIINTNMSDPSGNTMDLLVTAKAKGTTTLTIQYFVQIGSYYYVDSTHTTTITVEDTSPSRDATLSALTIQAATGDKTIYDFGFKPDVTDYTGKVLELPYICQEYQIQAMINDPKCQDLPVYVSAQNIKGEDATGTLFGEDKVQTITDEDGNTAKWAVLKHGELLAMNIKTESSVYKLRFHFAAQDPSSFNDYWVNVMRIPPSTDDRLANLTFFDERDKSEENQLLQDFDPETTTYVMDVAFGAKRLKVAALQNFPQALVAFSPALQTLNNNPKTDADWMPREYLDLKALEAGQQYQYVAGYGNLPYFEVKVMPESEHKDQFKSDGTPAIAGVRYTRTYRICIHRLPPSENSRLADQNGITVINSAELGNNPRALPFSPNYSAFTHDYFMTGRQALPFSTKQVRFKITPADETATVYIYSVSKEGAAVVTPSRGGTLAGSGLAPFLGIGRSEADPTRPTREFPMILTEYGEYTDPIALEARREDGTFNTNELRILVVSEAGTDEDYHDLIEDAEKTTHDPDLAKFYTLYKLEIERLPASTDADLTNVVVRDVNGNEQKLFSFHKDETSYTFTVPYEAERVSFTPTLSYPAGATVQLKDSGNPVHAVAGSVFPNLLDKLLSGVESRLYDLNDWRGEPRTFTLIVKSEAFLDSSQSDSEKWANGLAKEYTFTIRRGAPSTDARLKRLEVSGITEDGLSPIFKASQADYTATVQPGGDSQVTITPTVNEPHATIRWWEAGDEGGAQIVQSGTATDPIELVEEHTVIYVEVTAQDGETKQRYSIDFYNPNVVDLTNNADLASLKIERGVMTPTFTPDVIAYEVAVKEDTWSVAILPKPADPLATVQVFEGTREMGDYNNNYALALKNGANTVTVRVTSPDGTRTKDYTVTIYRGDEEHQKTLKPLTAEDLGEEIFKDPSVNPIIISVVEYPRIQSDVFQALKDATADDPDKTIVLQGNDFSLTFRGADLDTIIPSREIYDFSMSFSSPDEARINELVGGYAANVDVLGEVVMVYFDYHGDLPGTATLHINVGNKYASQPLFWHYYNRERDRIDYYGTVQSNSQGTFAVLIDHFSTYLVTRYHMIAGAEDRSGSVSLNVGSLGAGGKINPQTGAGQHRTGDKP